MTAASKAAPLVDARTWTLVLNTLLLTAGTCAVSVPVGTLLAWILTRTDVPGRRIGAVAVALMLFVPPYLQAAAWQAGFGLQGCYTLACSTPAWLQGWTGAIWVHAISAVPWVTLIVGAGLRLVEPELEEQALLDGSPGQVFFRVTLRSMFPAVAIAALWIGVLTAGEMSVTDLFSIRTYAEEVYTQSRFGSDDTGQSLNALPGVAVTGLLVGGGLLLCTRLAPRDRPLTLRRPWVFATGRWRLPLTLILVSALLLLVAVPLGNLLFKAGVRVVETETGRARAWSVGKCLWAIVLTPWTYRREFGWSFVIGLSAATTGWIAAIPLAWWARRGGLRSLPALALTATCLAVPGPVLGLGIIRLLNWPEIPWLFHLYDHSILAPWLALSVRALPPATLVLWHTLRTIPAPVLDSAAVDGAGPLTSLVRIVLPLRWSAVLAAWLVALVVALGDLAAGILVLPPGVQTLAFHVFDLLHAGVEDQVAGICLALIALFAALTAAAVWLGTGASHALRP